MQVLITGATGFVGENLSHYLEGYGHKIQKLSLRSLEWRTKIPMLFDAIIHLAGRAHDTSNTSAPEEYFSVNRDLTIELFHTFLKSDIKDFFYFSSVKAVADTIDGILYENDKAAPKTPYGKSKLEAEQYLLTYNLPPNKRLFIIRPCMIHGPGNKGNLNLLYNVVKKGIPWPLANFENQRSFLSIDNLCFLIEKMLIKPSLKSGVYNFADDESLSTNQVVELISTILQKRTKLWFLNRSFIKTIARIGDNIKLPLNSERLKKLTESYIVSNQKIKDVLDLSNLPTSAKEGLKITIQSFDYKRNNK